MNPLMKRLTDDLESKYQPLLFKACHPRQILPPTGYCNPRFYGSLMSGSVLTVQDPSMQQLAHVTGYMSALLLMANRVPTYFISYEFAEAVANTELPGDFKFAELKWPMEAQLFVLPDQFVKLYYGCYAPFLAVSRCPKGYYPDQLRLPVVDTELVGSETTEDKMVLQYPIFHADTTPTDYNANYPLSMGIEALKDAPWCDSTPYERQMNTFRYGPLARTMFVDELTPEQEQVFIQKAQRLAMKLMLCVAARPGIVEHGRIARPASVDRKGRVRHTELWSPNVIGRSYRIPRKYSERAAVSGDRAKPRFVYRRGHWAWAAKRIKGLEFVSVDDMPHKPDPEATPATVSKVGLIDFDSAGQVMADKFRACHERTWVEGFLFGDQEAPEMAQEAPENS